MGSNVLDSMRSNRGMVAVVLGALVTGLGAGYWLSRDGGSTEGKPDQPIEWHRVQAVPTRAPDVDDVEWQDRSNALDAPEAPEANSAGDNGADVAALENAAQ